MIGIVEDSLYLDGDMKRRAAQAIGSQVNLETSSSDLKIIAARALCRIEKRDNWALGFELLDSVSDPNPIQAAKIANIRIAFGS